MVYLPPKVPTICWYTFPNSASSGVAAATQTPVSLRPRLSVTVPVMAAPGRIWALMVSEAPRTRLIGVARLGSSWLSYQYGA